MEKLQLNFVEIGLIVELVVLGGGLAVVWGKTKQKQEGQAEQLKRHQNLLDGMVTKEHMKDIVEPIKEEVKEVKTTIRDISKDVKEILKNGRT